MRKFSIFLFVFLALCADLKATIFPYIHWIAWIVLIFPFMVKDFIKKGFVQSPFLILSIVIFLIGCFTSSMFGANLETVFQVVKFILIFITLYYFLHYRKISWQFIFNVINFTVIINFVLLMLGINGITLFSQLMTADGRWGTILAYPGSLVKIGAYGFYLNIMFLLFGDKRKKIVSIVMLLLSLFVIYMDGSRTGMLVVILTITIIPILYSIVNFRNKFKSVVIPVAILIFFIGLCIMLIPYLLKSRIGISIINLLNSTSFIEGLEKVDSIRFIMYQTAIEKIYNNPYIGTGSFSTVGVYPDGSSMVVHNTYLQLWGDYGFIGFLGMMFIYFGWLAFIPKIMTKLQLCHNQNKNAIVCSSMLMLIYFIINGLFHPYSTEFSEWIIFIISLYICFDFYRKKLLTVGEK